MSDHPRLAYIQPRTAASPPTLIVVYGEQSVSVPLSMNMVVQLAEQTIGEIRKCYSAEPPRFGD